jgi:hypothetical protein
MTSSELKISKELALLYDLFTSTNTEESDFKRFAFSKMLMFKSLDFALDKLIKVTSCIVLISEI